MELNRVVKVFLASPMDVMAERQIFMQMLERINASIGRSLHLEYRVLSWEHDVIPDKGDDAQDVVNNQVELDYDIFVSIFRDRIGTPTGRAASGTIEEYERALVYRCANPDLKFMCYFLKSEKEESQIRELKARMDADGVLFTETEDIAAFENAIYKHFTGLLLKLAQQMGSGDEKQTALRKSASVALVAPDGRVLLVRRSASSRYGAGQWTFPGGKLDTNEEPRAAAVREVHEELGILLNSEALQQINVFHTYFQNDRTQPFDMYLFRYAVSNAERAAICLNEENQSFEWVSLTVPELYGKRFLGINRDMFRALWQEEAGLGVLERVLEDCRRTDTDELPTVVPGVAPEKLQSLYAMLTVLGFTTLEDTVRMASPYSRKLLEALLHLSRSGGSLFEDNQRDPAADFRLQPKDYEVLRQHRERTLYSHKALLAMLSCKVELPHSVRNVSDVLIFGKYGGELYILLRWDFYSNKYQLPASGVDDLAGKSQEELAQHVIASRISPVAVRYFSYLPIKTFTTCHFGAGSVDNDPILRQYIIHSTAALVRNESRADFLEALELVNTTTRLAIEYSLEMTDEQCRRLNRFVWCSVDRLLEERVSYHGRPVRGFEELVSKIGHADLMRFMQSAVELDESCVHDDLEENIALLKTKRI